MHIPPSILLATLIALASVTGAVMYTQKAAKLTSASPDQALKVIELQKRIEILEGENETLKKLQVNGAEITLPIDYYKFVEKNLGLTFPKHVTAVRVDDDRLAEAVRYRYTQQFGIEGMSMREYAFIKLGIIPPNQNLLAQIALAETTGAVAIYDASANEILLSGEFDDENLFHITSVIRHLSIALLELNFPITENEKLDLTDDTFHAREGFIRGRASSIAQRYRNITAFKGGHIKQVKPNEEAKEIIKSLPLFVRGLTTFPTIHGKTYIEDIMLQNDSVFPELYKNIPRSTATIFAKRMPSENAKQDSLPLAADQHLRTELGQLILMLYLRQLGDGLENENLQLFRKLTSDELIISQERNIHLCTWTTNWASENDAAIFHKLATELSSIPEDKPSVSISNNQVIIKFKETHNS